MGCRRCLPFGLVILSVSAACSSISVQNEDNVASSPVTGVQTTRGGAFTAAQAARGSQVYDAYCASCHPADFYEAQLAIWEGTAVSEFLDALMATMPSENPGALATSQYVDVIAYIFSITGSPAGMQELTIDNAGSVRITNE